MTAISHILFPFDFSAQGTQIAPFVSSLARGFGATVTLYSVVPPAFDAAPAGLARESATIPGSGRAICSADSIARSSPN